MLLRSHLFRKVTIAGVGLMGGSLGLALKKFGIAKEIVGLSKSNANLDEAIRLGAVDSVTENIEEALRNSDLVVLATPVDTIVTLLPMLQPYLRRGMIVTDVGSVKGAVVDAAEKILGQNIFFVGSHPLAGSEKKGVENSTADLFVGSKCIMTPTESTNPVAKEKIKHMWSKIGAEVQFMSPEEHDQVLGYISHLPHLAAFALIESIPQENLVFAPAGLRDTTRIASSSPQMWGDIALANSRPVLKALDEYVLYLSQLRKAIVNRDKQALVQHFTKANEKRQGLRSPS